ncbi:type II secretion system F family protein [Ammoniphilus resinae]|uniref:Flp pilus assembly protein TadB n=1 Tax=Ammoniphilus resinae TaxID=861532 RepID=A0ABS4GNG2_9BACL|nr:type II secretion system F family protein [Ammoniphilus resinae]MBP1931814.1 Flp pilus assembly protein TadB [Ammoniphilus resinae]
MGYSMIWGFALTGSLALFIYELLQTSNTQDTQRALKWIERKNVEKHLDEWVAAKNKKAYNIIQNADDLLKKSRIRIGGRPLNKYIFLIVMLVTSIVAFVFSSNKLNNPVAGILIGGIVGYLYFHLLAWDAKHRKRTMRKQTPNFFLTLLNFYEVHQDILLALKDTGDRIKKPIKTDMQYLVVQLQNGDITLRETIVEAKEKLDNKLLRDFLDDLELQIRFGGNFSQTLQNYINDSTEKEVRILERESETAGASLVTYFLLGIYIFLVIMLNKTQPEAMHLLVTHFVGKIVVVAMIAIILFVLYVTKEMTASEDD